MMEFDDCPSCIISTYTCTTLYPVTCISHPRLYPQPYKNERHFFASYIPHIRYSISHPQNSCNRIRLYTLSIGDDMGERDAIIT